VVTRPSVGNPRRERVQDDAILTTSGLALLIVVTIGQLAYGSGLLDWPVNRITITIVGAAAVMAAAWLLIALAFAILRWRRTTTQFRLVLAAYVSVASAWAMLQHLGMYSLSPKVTALLLVIALSALGVTRHSRTSARGSA